MIKVDRKCRRSPIVTKLEQSVNYLLNEEERVEFRQIIDDYHRRKNIVDLCHSLSILLDTPAKRQIAKHLRNVVAKSDVARFDQYMSTSSIVDVDGPPNQGGGRPSGRRHSRPYATIGHHRPGGSGTSVASAPSYHVPATLPRSGSRIIKRPMAHTDFLGDGRTSAPEWETRTANVKRIRLDQPPDPTQGLGFSIRGGAEHGIGIYVSYVDSGSRAEREGLEAGDQILSVNGVSFRRITHLEAANIVKASHSLDMEVRHVGRIPGSLETHQSYTWVDEFGRTVSPPPEVDQSGRYNTTDGRKSGLMLLKDTDERKVNLVVSESKTLGISIRGGNEFGLGIYITQVDYGSPADNAGLKVGDQIMDVNGRTFLDISHGDAVKVLKSSRHLMITVKDVGKLPYARTTYDHTEWIPDDQLTLTARQQPRHANKGTVRAETSSLSGRYATLQATDSMFCRGAGSQLMHNSMMSHTTQMALIEESARSLLNDNQHATLKYYIDDYQKGFIQVEALLLALFEVLNTKRKFALLTDIRGIIHPKDLKTFDHLVLQKEVTLLKSKSMESLYPLPHESDDESMDISYSHYGWPKTSNQVTSQASEEEIDALRQAIELIENDRRQERKSQKKGHKLKIGLGSLKGKKKHTAPPIPDTKADAEIHKTDRRLRKDARCSSEDSGVEVNGSGHTSQNTSTNQKKEACSRTNASSNGYHGKYMSLGRKNAYSLIDTAVSDGSNPNPMQSSPSELEDRLDMFKTLPAQFESEMVHANIQTEEDWSNTSSGFGSQEHSRNEDNPQKVRLFSVASEGDLRSISPSVVLHHNKGDRTMDSLLQISPLDGATEAALDQMNGAKREESNQDGLGRPQKPPRTHRSINRKQSAVECEQEDMRSIASSIPDINLDHMCTSGSLRTWDKDSELTLEPLSIVPPPPPSDQLDKSSSTAVDANNYKLFDIPFDDMDLSYAVAPPTQTSLQLSPIAIVPPPPPMESTFGLDNLRLDSDSPILQNSNRGNTDHQTPPPRQTSPDDNDVMKSVVIHKTRPTLGLAIEGGAKTRQPLPRIINIQPGGAAAQCHDLDIGDVIVQVNGQPLDGKLHRQCAKIIATAFKDKQTNTMVLGISKCSRKMKV